MRACLLTVFVFVTASAQGAVVASQFEVQRNSNGTVIGYPIQYLAFEVTENAEVTIDLLSYEFYEQYFDP